jgi:hypothetical protein
MFSFFLTLQPDIFFCRGPKKTENASLCRSDPWLHFFSITPSRSNFSLLKLI